MEKYGTGGETIDSIKADLYSDLPPFKRVKEFKDFDAFQLVHRYNCAQIQGLLLRAIEVRITINEVDLSSKRRFLRNLKFCRLLGEVYSEDGSLTIKISGPLAIFDGTVTYGMRLAQFFPYLLLEKKWSLEADVKLKDKVLSLKASFKKPIESHYRDRKTYIPDEFQNFVDAFNEASDKKRYGFRASLGDSFYHIGRQSYCFPDFSLSSENSTYHIELFHKWHKGQLSKRLESLAYKEGNRLIIGVCKTLQKQRDFNKIIEKHMESGLKIFGFTNFPTPRAVLTQLAELL